MAINGNAQQRLLGGHSDGEHYSIEGLLTMK